MRYALLAIAAALLVTATGCSSIPAPLMAWYEPGPDKTGAVIRQYCERMSPGIRANFRYAVNVEAQPHAIYVHCDGEPPPWEGDADG